MHTLLIFLLLTLLAFVLVTAWVVRKLYRASGLKALVDLLRGESQQSGSSAQQGTGPAQDAQRRTTTDTGAVVVDQRDPKVATRKIFGKDEGEYVDFQECRPPTVSSPSS